jgi:hypothetical protein
MVDLRVTAVSSGLAMLMRVLVTVRTGHSNMRLPWGAGAAALYLSS